MTLQVQVLSAATNEYGVSEESGVPYFLLYIAVLVNVHGFVHGNGYKLNFAMRESSLSAMPIFADISK